MSAAPASAAAKPRRVRPNWTRRYALSLAVPSLVFIVLIRYAAWRTESWWFQAMGHPQVLQAVVATRWALFAAGTAVWLAVFGLGLRTPLSALRPASGSVAHPPASPPPQLRRWIIAAVVAGAAAGGLWSAGQWQAALLATSAQAAGLRDAIFSRDLSFWLFVLPFWQWLWVFGVCALWLLLAGALTIYCLTGDIDLDDHALHCTSRVRAFGLRWAAVLLLWKALGLPLYAYSLALSQHGAVSGVGYTDYHVRLPLTGCAIVLTVATALALWRLVAARRQQTALCVLGAYYALSLLLGLGVPALVQRLWVVPQQASREAPFIKLTVAATRRAYWLDTVQNAPPAVPTAGNLAVTARGLPMWPAPAVRAWLQAGALDAATSQLVATRIGTLHLDAYPGRGGLRPCYVAAGEAPAGITSNIGSWQRRRIVNIHGDGISVCDAAHADPNGSPLLLPQTQTLKHSQLYFARFPEYPAQEPLGLNNGQPAGGAQQPRDFTVPQLPEPYSPYALFGAAEPSRDSAAAARPLPPTPASGIALGNFWRRCLFALRFGDVQLLSNNAVLPTTRVVWHRRVGDRCRSLAPFLQFSDDPLPVVVDGRAFWLLDGFTRSSSYPQSIALDAEQQPRYLRAPVVATIDAYSGAVNFYLVDTTDPVANAWARRFKGLFAPLAAMPPALRRHVHYPHELLKAQAAMWSRCAGDTAREYLMRATDPDPLPAAPSFAVLPPPGKIGAPGAAPEPEPEPALTLIWPLVDADTTPASRRPLIGCLLARRDGSLAGAAGRLWLWRPPQPLETQDAVDKKLTQNGTLRAYGIEGATAIGPGTGLSAFASFFAPWGKGLLYGGNAARGGVLPTDPEDKAGVLRAILALRLKKSVLTTQKQPLWIGDGADKALQAALRALAPRLSAAADGAAPRAKPEDVRASTTGQSAPIASATMGGPPKGAALMRQVRACYQRQQAARRAGDWAAYDAASRELQRLLAR